MKIHNQNDFEQGIVIEDVSSYLKIIHDFQDKIKNDPKIGGLSQDILFRGQETEFWDLKPSIFRNNMIGVEHILMQEPLRQFPNEFNDRQDDFDILTKYQHYGLCTRLLDMTTNPLIALYFACQEHGEVEYKSETEDLYSMEPSGLIYYKVAYKYYSESLEVRVISALARMNMDETSSIKELTNQLYKKKIISEEQLNKWNTEDGVIEFINLIQVNYMVYPLYSNERLIRQNGIFLLPGCFNVNIGNTKLDSAVSKGYQDLREEFEEQYIYVTGENKKKIREELDNYNINEAILFPELEHKLNYIRNKYEGRIVDYFTKYVDITNRNKELPELEEVSFDKEKYIEAMKEFLLQTNDHILVDEIIQVLVDNMSVDWFKKESILSKMRRSVLKLYLDKGVDKKEKQDEVRIIVEKAVEIYYEQAKKE